MKEKYGEMIHFSGVNNSGYYTFWGNEETGTWTVILSEPDGYSCLLSSGQNFTIFNPIPEPKGDPT